MAELREIMETSKLFHDYGPSFIIMEGVSTIMAIIVHNYGTVWQKNPMENLGNDFPKFSIIMEILGMVFPEITKTLL